MKTIAEIIDIVEEYGRSERNGYSDRHELLAEIERAIKEREAAASVLRVDRTAAQNEYARTAFHYPSAPVGSRDWALFWRGWQAACEHSSTKESHES
jgi:hypothetical protein